jgi:EAL domain-containing protein (putative c-di-GMP-specific phosphodiesterase class I)
MARALSMDVIAEGVENEAQLSELQRLGCDYAQGFLFSRPLPARQIGRMLSAEALGYSGILPGK